MVTMMVMNNRPESFGKTALTPEFKEEQGSRRAA